MSLKDVARLVLIACAAGLCGAAPAMAQFRGHGGPVKAIAVSGERMASASFDSTLILWSMRDEKALQVFRFHDGAVHAVAMLPDGRLASAGEDRRIALWRPGSAAPERVLEGHEAPVLALAVSADGGRLASASFDGSARLWDLASGAGRVVATHEGGARGVAFAADGRLASVGQDGILRLDGVPATGGGLPLNGVVRAGRRLVAAGSDGGLQLAGPNGEAGNLRIADRPLTALAASPDGRLVAVAGLQGTLAIVELASGTVLRRLEGPAFPLWSLAFSADGSEILTAGNDRLVRRWSVATGEPASVILTEPTDAVLERHASHPGAAVFRACVACHTLTADDGNRAGPSLHRLMGRRIATAAGYDFSPALRQMDIVWTPETVSRLFEIGPAAYTPGTKMPEQRIPRAEDRKALTDFLALVGN